MWGLTTLCTGFLERECGLTVLIQKRKFFPSPFFLKREAFFCLKSRWSELNPIFPYVIEY